MTPIIIWLRRIAVSLSCLCLAQFLNAQLTHTVTFDHSLLNIDTTVVDSVSYLKIKYLDLWGEGSIGSPELPVHYLRFSVPYNATDFTVTVTGQNAVTEQYSLPVYPVQPPISSDLNASEQPFVAPDSAIYGSTQYSPATPVQVADEGFLDGDNHIVTIAVWPISYAPANGEILFRNSVTIRLDYTLRNGNTAPASAPTPTFRAITRRNVQRVHRWGREQTKLMVVNPSQVDAFAPISIARAAVPLNEATVLPSYEYTVVTNRELAPAFDRLLGWKRQKGLSAGVVCIEDILACPDFQGDTLSHIYDSAGKLRAYLEHAYKLGSLQYALLAGDYSILPIRYGYRKDYHFMFPPDNVDKMIPTDLYFSDFNGNWDSNRNYYYGEPNVDQIDYYPEIFVGRLLCTTQQEIANYTEKLLRYERNPGNGNYEYLQKAFYCQSDQLQENNEAEIIKSAWGTTFIEHKIMQEEPSFDANETTGPTGKQVIDEMNNRYGFLSWHGHGAPSHIVMSSNGLNEGGKRVITAFQNVNSGNFIQESGHGLDCLTNHDYPAIAYSIACTTTPFDIYNNYNISYNIGSSFTVAGLYGGPAFLGNTREGFYENQASATLEKEFANLVKTGNCIGAAEALSKAYLNENKDSINKGSTDLAHKVILAHHLIGCPEFSMWTGIPTEYRGITVSRTDNSIIVAGNGLDSSRVALTSGIYALPEVKTVTGTSITFTGASPNSVVTVYKHNAIPYVAPLYLQNDTIRSSQYFLVNDIHIGRAVDANRTEGNVVIESGTLTFESNGDVWIGDGLIIKGGATLIIKNTGKAILSGGVVEGGGTLQIEAGEGIEMLPGFEAKTGANVEFKQPYLL